MPTLTQNEIDQRIYDLYDEYCHGNIDRREFLQRASVLTVGGLSMAQALLPRYALAQTISFTDPRIKARYLTYPSPGGTSGTMRGYLVQPNATGPFPAVLVIHENRGLNPYIEDVTRRAATEGFLAFAPDGLSPVGGYPGNDDDGRALQASLDQSKLRTDMINGARFLKAHSLSTGKLGVTGFCWGGSTTNFLAVDLGADLKAAVAGALYGTPDEIAAKLEILRDGGAAYVLLNSAGGPPALRRFAHEVRPAFADASTLQPA
ncbi:MAG: dienelactone hydrolase [Candidatus Rokuibacteriota bacterium]|nr:MAG: dienelactone hydrolase [Candidatus Rokubacteria bacterium]